MFERFSWVFRRPFGKWERFFVLIESNKLENLKNIVVYTFTESAQFGIGFTGYKFESELEYYKRRQNELCYAVNCSEQDYK